MRLIKMFLMRFKASVKKPYVWAFIVIAIITALIPAMSSKFASKTALPLGLVNEDGGVLSMEVERYMADFRGDIDVYNYSREKALRYLAMGRLEAIYVINDGFTDKLSQGEYDSVITLYTAPASTAAQTLTEAVVNSTLAVWMEEKAMLAMNEFLGGQGIPFSDAEQQAIRERFDEVLKGDNTVDVISHIPAPPEVVSEGPFLTSSAWYAAFSALFVIVSAGWVIDTRRQALGERMRAEGVRPISAYAGSALSIIALSMLGWCVSQAAVSIILRTDILMSVRLLIPMLLYMAGLMGLTVTISSLTTKTVQLMLVAPVFAVTQGVLCGMLLKLPDWAGLLNYVADALPGRWFLLGGGAMLTGTGYRFLLGLLLCSAAWIALGMLAVTARTRSIMRAKG